MSIEKASVILREVKGSPLEHDEMDGNLSSLKTSINNTIDKLSTDVFNLQINITAEVQNRINNINSEKNIINGTITSEITNINNAIVNSINTEITNRNTAINIALDAFSNVNNTIINNAINTEIINRNNVITESSNTILGNIPSNFNSLEKLHSAIVDLDNKTIKYIYIVNDLNTDEVSKPLSASMGVELKRLLDNEIIRAVTKENDIEFNISNLNSNVYLYTDTSISNALNVCANTYAPITHIGSAGIEQHALVSDTVPGFMSPEDKNRLQNTSGINTGDQVNVLGNAGTATKLEITRNINGVQFNGTSDITINAIDSTSRIASSDIGITIPSLVSGVVPDNELPIYVKSVNGVSGLVVINKSTIGLSNVDNTSDNVKPVSTAQALANNVILSQANTYTDLESNRAIIKENLLVPKTTTVNGHSLSTNINITPTDIGLDLVNNTSDINKPVSTSQANANTTTLNSAKTYTDLETTRATTAENLLVAKTVTVNGHALFSNISVTAIDVGLGNVNNTSDTNKPVSTAQATADTNTLNSAKAYTDNLVVSLLDDRGNHNASTGSYPTIGGSGISGAINKSDFWYINVAGVINGVSFNVGDSIRSLIDNPGQTTTNWSALEANIGYVPYNATNPAGYQTQSDVVTLIGSNTSSTATKLATARKISVSGDISGFANFDGSTDITISSILPVVLSKVGTYGDSTHIPSITTNAKGQIVDITAQLVNIVSTLSNLTDVSFSGLADKNVAIYNSTTSKWENKTLLVAGIQPTLGVGMLF